MLSALRARELKAALRPPAPYAFWISFQVTALPLCGGILSPLAIGAVVEGVSIDCQKPS